MYQTLSVLSPLPAGKKSTIFQGFGLFSAVMDYFKPFCRPYFEPYFGPYFDAKYLNPLGRMGRGDFGKRDEFLIPSMSVS